MSTTIETPATRDARALMGDHWPSIVQTILDNNEGMAPEMAGRIAEEGVKFVIACAQNPGTGLAPSRIVDEGWHALILHTGAYAELCATFGEFVHHFPGPDPTHYDPTILDRTKETIDALGFDLDAELWAPPTDDLLVSVAAKCQHAPSCTIRPMPKPEWP
ncbi:glycine-rich domain-containing protein [Streptomyces sp. CA-294286]|uniref:glycine-rich domain-containing protein n=1 Tax=Streptomyces sp. CA-294286 TaxID=3240070 RepID=UPI003D8E23FC